MSAQHPRLIISFVIRFIVEEEAKDRLPAPPFRGLIQHVQSDETLNFSEWQDAVAFIQRYVPLEFSTLE